VWADLFPCREGLTRPHNRHILTASGRKLGKRGKDWRLTLTDFHLPITNLNDRKVRPGPACTPGPAGSFCLRKPDR
jgi:hypothetical protein